jgi:hypothetical protein
MTFGIRRVVALGIASAALVTLVMHDANGGHRRDGRFTRRTGGNPGS